MARYCDNDNCEGRFHTAACATSDTGLDMADETAMEDGYARPTARRNATVTPLPQPRQGGAAA